jgi:hypothetical protein
MMDVRKRMERTLFCLLLSMTAGAMVLHFGQPDRSLAGAARTGLTARHETTIYVHSQADSEGKPLHFFVDRDGKASPTDRWLTASRQGSVHIGLQTSSSRPPTSRQWQTTETLIQQLRQQFSADARVVYDETLRSSPGGRPPLGQTSGI